MFWIGSIIAFEKEAPQVNVWDIESRIEGLCRHLDQGSNLRLDFTMTLHI